MNGLGTRQSMLEAVILDALTAGVVGVETDGSYNEKAIAHDLAKYVAEHFPPPEPPSDPYFVEAIAVYNAQRIAALVGAFCDHLLSCGWEHRHIRDALGLILEGLKTK